jgi:hypothetical protein
VLPQLKTAIHKTKRPQFLAAAFDETLLTSTNSANKYAAHREPNWAQCGDEMFNRIHLKHGNFLNELTSRDSIRVFFTIQQVGLDFFITLY